MSIRSAALAAVTVCLLATVAGAQAASLYTGPGPRPGPDILYAPAFDAPQLQNTGIWRAAPILISGASAYRDGEFLYQDYLYDDHGALGVPDPTDPRTGIPGNPLAGNLFSRPAGSYTYPRDPIYANNAADLVEFRVRALTDATVFRVTLNTLLDSTRSAFTIALGTAGSAAAEAPFGANTRARADWFLTVHGNTAVLSNARTGAVSAVAPVVSVDPVRRQIEVRVPRSVWNPGTGVARFAIGVGLWDVASDRYLLPLTAASQTRPGGRGRLLTPSAFFNAGFRYDELLPDVNAIAQTLVLPAWWRDRRQATTLAGGDFGNFYATVDFAKLAGNVNDDMANQPGGTPTVGALNRIMASRFETAQGANYSVVCGGNEGCLGELRGRLQPYAIYVPSKPEPIGGYGLTLLLHSLAGNYNQYSGSRNQSQLGERGRGHIVITPTGRGPDGWYVEYAGADTFEVWADAARHYNLSPDHVAITGYSMGGYGTFRNATRYPDLFAAAQTAVGPPGVGFWVPPFEPTGGEASNTFHQLAGLRHIPIQMWIMLTDQLVPFPGPQRQANELARLGYRYEYRSHTPGEHLTLAINDSWADAATFLGDAVVDRNPARISYVVNPKMDFANVGMVADHAYWLSGLRLRNGTGDAPRASIEAFSHAFGAEREPIPSGIQRGVGLLTDGFLPVIAYTRQLQTWARGAATPIENRLSLTVRNLAAITVTPSRARLGCDAVLDVDTDGPVTVTLDGCQRSVRYGG